MVAKMGNSYKQICWQCKKCLKGCSWSRYFKPVDGWSAIPVVIKNYGYKTKSYKILHCPEFEGEEPKPANKDCARFLGVSERMFYRLRTAGKLPKNIYQNTRKFLEEELNGKFNNRTVTKGDR